MSRLSLDQVDRRPNRLLNRRVLAVVASAGALLVAGCGGEKKVSDEQVSKAIAPYTTIIKGLKPTSAEKAYEKALNSSNAGNGAGANTASKPEKSADPLLYRYR